MKTVVKITNASLGLLMLLTVAMTASAQERPSFEAGPYLFNLGLTAGYRSITVEANGVNPSEEWAQQRFYEVGNYRGTGLNLKSFNLTGERVGNEGMFDQLFVNADGIGDPFTTASLRMRSFNAYDLKLSYKNAKYYMNRNDSIYTGLHKYDRTRQFLNASLEVNASEDISLKAGFNSSGRSGNMTTTISPFVMGGEELAGPGGTTDGSFGTYARGNFYWGRSEVNDKTNEFNLAATIKVPTTNFTVGGGYRTFSQDYVPGLLNDTSLTYYPALGTVNWAGVFAGFPNSAAKAVDNPMNLFEWHDKQESKTPFGFFEAVSRPAKDISIVANVRYEDTKMDGHLDGLMNGIMPRRTGGGIRYLGDTTEGHYTNTLKSLVGSLSITGEVIEGLRLTGLYRYTNTDLEVEGEYMKNVGATDTVTSQVYKSIVVSPFDNIVASKMTKNFIEGFVNYMPMNTLSVRAGVQLDMRTPEYDREVEGKADSASNLNLSRESQGITPFFNFWYRPVREVKFNGQYSHSDVKVYNHGTTTEADFAVRTTPKTTDKYSIGVDIEPMEELSFGLHFQGSNGSSDLLNMLAGVTDAKMTNDVQSVGGSVRYQFIEQAQLNLTTEYKKNDFVIPATWTRGQYIPNPYRPYGDSMTASVEQHTKDLYFDASINSNPIKELNVVVGFSMITSDGGTYMTPNTVDSALVSGKMTKIYPDVIRVGGPYTWSLVHAQASYDITPSIGVMVDFQLAAQKEDQVENYVAVFNNYKVSIIRGNLYFHL